VGAYGRGLTAPSLA